jgi:regulator of cell morphogenesis and NO signaling
MEQIYQKKVGQVVADDFRAAAVFEKYGIDFCCKGNITVDEACESKHIMTEDVMRELKMLLSTDTTQPADYKTWNPVVLADHILENHHRYITEKTPLILQYLAKLADKHGGRHPELLEVNRLFTESAAALASHMKKEELILFPWIKKLAEYTLDQGQDMATPQGRIRNPIEMMMHEHDDEGERFKTISAITNQYQPPSDACNTYKVTYAMLQEFETDLHLHIHLENNILFPKASEMERELMN